MTSHLMALTAAKISKFINFSTFFAQAFAYTSGGISMWSRGVYVTQPTLLGAPTATSVVLDPWDLHTITVVKLI